MGDIAGPKVWFCATYFDELDHLQAQLEMLEYSVDGFILCEGTRTHQGDLKPLYLDFVEKLAGLPDTVVRLVADLSDYDEPWDRENAQRDYIGQYVRALPSLYAPDDILVVVDIDEHLNPGVVKYIPHALDVAEGPVALAMRMHYYGLGWEDPQVWLHPRALRVRDLPESLSALREGIVTKAVHGAGWHISYTGGPERRAAKLRAYAHAEQNNETTHALIATAHETGIGPNGEELVRVTDLDGVPEALVRRFG